MGVGQPRAADVQHTNECSSSKLQRCCKFVSLFFPFEIFVSRLVTSFTFILSLHPVPLTTHTLPPRLTCNESVAQQGYCTVFKSGQLHADENIGIGSQWLKWCLVFELLQFDGTVIVGSSVGRVVGTFSDVDSGTETVGSAMIVEGSGTGSMGDNDDDAACGCARGTAAASADRKQRVTAHRMARRWQSDRLQRGGQRRMRWNGTGRDGTLQCSKQHWWVAAYERLPRRFDGVPAGDGASYGLCRRLILSREELLCGLPALLLDICLHAAKA